MQVVTQAPSAGIGFADAFEQLADAVVVLDAWHTVRFFNAAAERLWGLSRGEVLGRHARLLLPSALRQEDGCDLERLLVRNLALDIQRSDGTLRQVLFSMTRSGPPEAPHYTALVKDVTQARLKNHPMLQMARAIDASDNAIIVADPNGKVVAINGGVTRMLGFDLADMVGRRPDQILAGPHTDPHTLKLLRANLQSYVVARQGLGTELLIYTKASKPLWVSVTMNPVFDEAGQLVNVLGVLADITFTKMHEVLQNKVLAAMVREVPVRDVMTLLCREVERIAPEVIATVLAIDAENRVRPLAAPGLPEYVSQALDGVAIGPNAGSCGTAAWRGEAVAVTDIATDPLWTDYKALILPLGLKACWSSPIRSGSGQVMGTFAFYFRENRGPDAFHLRLVDVCVHLCALMLEREKVRTHIHKLVFFDTLTGLPNRATLHAKAERAIYEASRSGAPLALLHLDVDRFKQINDKHGHAVGDALLRELARRFKEIARETDTVGRLGSDEFALLLPHCSAQQAASVAERLCEAAREPVHALGAVLQAGASLGIAISPDDGSDVDTLMRHADTAMYQAKTSGRSGANGGENRGAKQGDRSGQRSSFRFFSAEMNRAAEERAMLEADLKLALRHNGLALHYQPQVDAAGQKLLGLEALLRWQHASLGAVPPTRFVALAEECGLIDELGLWVLGQACGQLADWRRRGVPIPGIAVNLSASNFQNAELPAHVARLLQQHGLAPRDLTLEMTESVMLAPDPAVLAGIHAIHAQGVHLSMDDFGTGYSSLSYLHRLPISELKLDRSFVQDLAHSETARALTTSVLRIGESLALNVVAEGVETEAQRRFLAERGCPALQGYLFARPLPAADLENWVFELSSR
ncbi:hypothetical protein RD110_11275 [Rhodoferax koreense]|uniref:Bifunctional diguanylate cyclase/phosphodiesterase n=1 Tax=Rhodoferax koreensis TaxID=1842727 RepID=A0A1P8JVC7_9BURK|nr:EAL domain-containing protein [Rhodoferax koreense]APW37707.1 hypothetical protein RD110_11275 [Rhodoferax koreense]